MIRQVVFKQILNLNNKYVEIWGNIATTTTTYPLDFYSDPPLQSVPLLHISVVTEKDFVYFATFLCSEETYLKNC